MKSELYPTEHPLLTWFDVERKLKVATHNYTEMPACISNFSCYSDGLDVDCKSIEEARNWIKEVFPRDYDEAVDNLILSIANACFSVNYNEVIDDGYAKSVYPLWKHALYAPKLRSKDFSTLNTPIYAFHSFKGGVGRTSALTTFVSAIFQATKADEQKKILIIDSDLEAPGVSLWLSPSNKPNISYLSFLELIQYPTSTLDESLDYVVSELKKNSVTIDGSNKELFILPASLNLNDVMDMNITTEHIVSDVDNPFKLTDIIDKVASKLGVDFVFVDLRAGMSEISSPYLLDPRVEKFYVTTLAYQSIQGISSIISKVKEFNSENELDTTGSNLILGPLTQTLRELKDYQESQEMLLAALGSEEDLNTKNFEIFEVEFDSSLMAIRDLKHAMDVVKSSTLYKVASDWYESNLEKASDKVYIRSESKKDSLEKLEKFCEKIQFAENTSSSEMLITDPIRNLGKHFQSELPNIVSIGAKGAGKTFTYTQILTCKTWNTFLDKLNLVVDNKSENSNIDISPFLWSKNLSNRFIDTIVEHRNNLNLSDKTVNDKIASALVAKNINWDIFWEKSIVSDFNLPETIENYSDLNEFLLESNKKKILILDGIEDIFDTLDNQNQINALRALLDIPNRLRMLRKRNIGVMIFIREDYITQVISQNNSQFAERYSPFKLTWTSETFLRLVYWVCSQINLIEAQKDLADKLSLEELLSELEKLWGKKLGKNNSKEANSARWVFSALCDLNGRLQARDIIRFLKFAAKLAQSSQTGSTWGDRVLPPEPIRQTLNLCSIEKVTEAKQEIVPLRTWVTALEKISNDEKQSPFDPTKLNLEPDVLASLKNLGIIFEDLDDMNKKERYYLPEIYRHGLGFSQQGAGRPRVQAFLKKNLGFIPF